MFAQNRSAPFGTSKPYRDRHLRYERPSLLGAQKAQQIPPTPADDFDL